LNLQSATSNQLSLERRNLRNLRCRQTRFLGGAGQTRRQCELASPHLDLRPTPQEGAAYDIEREVGMYPLRQEHFSPAIEIVRLAFEARGLKPQIGPMSAHVVGEGDLIFAALAEAFAKAANVSEVVMTITVSNTCPIAS
jgi:uncharacterized protein YqgV (UPF0045/DUF77 family)